MGSQNGSDLRRGKWRQARRITVYSISGRATSGKFDALFWVYEHYKVIADGPIIVIPASGSEWRHQLYNAIHGPALSMLHHRCVVDSRTNSEHLEAKEKKKKNISMGFNKSKASVFIILDSLLSRHFTLFFF